MSFEIDVIPQAADGISFDRHLSGIGKNSARTGTDFFSDSAFELYRIIQYWNSLHPHKATYIPCSDEYIHPYTFFCRKFFLYFDAPPGRYVDTSCIVYGYYHLHGFLRHGVKSSHGHGSSLIFNF